MTRRNVLVIRTPEGIEFSLNLAGPFSRMLSFAMDLLVIAALSWMIRSVLTPLAVLGADATDALGLVLYFALLLIYGALTEWLWRGQTVGKRLFGLRVVDARGFRLEPSQVAVRNLMRFVDVLPLFYLVGGVACVLNRHRQRLGDIAAGTVVVRNLQLIQPDLDQVLGGKYNSLAEHRHLAARLRQKVTAETARIALDAVLRRDELVPAARLALFSEFAAHFRALVPYPADANEQMSDEQYVRNVVEILYRFSANASSISSSRERALS
jgi:uncharacterized RDD family membrane protein YckC